MDFIGAAFDLTRFGWKIFPLSPGQKIPAIPKSAGGHGCLDATDDEETISRWAKENPKANIGIACGTASNIIVIDLDPRNGSDESIARFAAQNRFFPDTVTAHTANGGKHLYYAYEPSLINSKSVLARGIDIKTTGGYVVAPPSALDGGKTYRWVSSPLGEYLPRLPRWIVEALKPKPQPPFQKGRAEAPKDISKLVDYVSRAGEGDRNNILFWATMRAVEAGMLTHECRSLLCSAAVSAGLSHGEASKTIASAVKKGRSI
jgi:hypothetical protein